MSLLSVSVVVPLYNAGHFVEAALDTVAAQMPRAAEVIVVDDGSTDDGAARVARRMGGALRLIRQSNRGVAAARNVGLRAASQPRVAFLDADDLWCPGHLARLVAASDWFPTAAVVGARFRPVPAHVTALDAAAERISATPPRRADYVAEAAQGTAPFYTSSCLVRRDAALVEGGFLEGESHGEDLALWIRLSERFGAAATDATGALYRRAAGGLTGRVVPVPDVAMRTLEALMASATPSRAMLMRQLRDRLATAHALDSLAQGDRANARAALAEVVGPLTPRRIAAMLLAAIPAPVCRAAFSLRSLMGGTR